MAFGWRNWVWRGIAAQLSLAIILCGITYAQSHDKKTFVLVHGAWVGEWYWDALVPLLRDEGHDVHTVSLTGHGSRAQLGGPHISVADHTADIVNLVISGDLSDIYLVGHSYGGKPVTGAWDLLRDRVHHVVYIDAIAPVARGQVAIAGNDRALSYLMVRYPGIFDTGMLPVPYGFTKSMRTRSKPQSLASLYGAVELSHDELPENTLRTYVIASKSPIKEFKTMAEIFSADPKWSVIEIDATHDVVGSGLTELVDLLVSLR